MPTRNTAVLTQIVETLGDLVVSQTHALARLEHRFEESLLIEAGDANIVLQFAADLRLRIDETETSQVLDYIAEKSLIGMSPDHVEEAINTLFGEDRFIEPEQ